VRELKTERQMTDEADPLDALRHAAAWAVTRGSLMFHLDLAATIAREHLDGNAMIADCDGWAVDVTSRGYEAVFVRDSPDSELAVVTFAADGSPIVEAGRGAPSSHMRALATAARSIAATGSRPPSTVIAIPPTCCVAPLRPMLSRSARIIVSDCPPTGARSAHPNPSPERNSSSPPGTKATSGT
jgi:hypothetical protein